MAGNHPLLHKNHPSSEKKFLFAGKKFLFLESNQNTTTQLNQSTEHNISLALFMGMTKKYSYIHGGIVYESGFSTYNEDELQYHKSFDWIVPVVQEITYRYPEICIQFQSDLAKNPYDKRHICKCCVTFVETL